MKLVAEAVGASGATEPREVDGERDRLADVSPEELGDADIVRLCIEGRTEFFSELVGRYTNVVATYLYSRLSDRDLSEELTQEVMVRAFEFLPRLKSPRNFAGWLLGIAHNTMARDLEQKGRSVSLDTSLLDTGEGDEPRPEEHLSSEELRKRTLLEVSRLPARYRIPLMLKYQSGHSCEQIADYLGLPVGTVTSRLSRAYQILHRDLGQAVSGERHGDRDESRGPGGPGGTKGD